MQQQLIIIYRSYFSACLTTIDRRFVIRF